MGKGISDIVFPANVRELKSILKKAAIMYDSEVLDDSIISGLDLGARKSADMSWNGNGPGNLTHGVERREREIVDRAMQECRSARELAKHLGVSQPTVVRRLRKYGLSTVVNTRKE